MHTRYTYIRYKTFGKVIEITMMSLRRLPLVMAHEACVHIKKKSDATFMVRVFAQCLRLRNRQIQRMSGSRDPSPKCQSNNCPNAHWLTLPMVQMSNDEVNTPNEKDLFQTGHTTNHCENFGGTKLDRTKDTIRMLVREEALCEYQDSQRKESETSKNLRKLAVSKICFSVRPHSTDEHPRSEIGQSATSQVPLRLYTGLHGSFGIRWLHPRAGCKCDVHTQVIPTERFTGIQYFHHLRSKTIPWLGKGSTQIPAEHVFRVHCRNKSTNTEGLPEILEEDLEETFTRGHGPGGQSVNKTTNCCVLKHLPTGIYVKVHETRSLHQNRKLARLRLRQKLDFHLNGEDSQRQVQRREASLRRKEKKKLTNERLQKLRAFKEREGLT